MCGFVGFTGKLERKKEIINKMMDRIIHRGPDMAGDYLDDDIALGFRRLSIIDLRETANQPMSSDDGLYTVVFNGEIYNFMDIRAKLETAGHKFKTNSDTEVLLHGY
nr:asparagine synthetase B [Clostridia bacterium]